VEPRIKGISLVHLSDFVRAEHGEDAHRELCRSLPGPEAKAFELPSAFDWYPLSQYIAIEKRVLEAQYGGDVKEAWRFGAFDLERALNVVYRIAFRFMSPADGGARSAKLFNTFIDQGAMEVTAQGDKRFLVRFPGLETADEVYCNDLRGSIIGTLRVCKIPEPKVEHVECRQRGGAVCTFEATW